MYTNDTIIPITSIGELPSDGLQCITDKISCCQSANLGAWFFFNRGFQRVVSNRYAPFYATRNNDGAVILNHYRSALQSPTGLTYCVVPDATGAEKRIYAHIG